MNAPSDDALIALLKASGQGDRTAFRSLYDLTAPRLMAVARRILRRTELAEEALQDGYLRIWRGAARFDPERGRPLSWMAVIIRRAALERAVKLRPEEPLEDDTAAMPVTFQTETGGTGLNRCLESLPALHRNAVVLAYVYGMSHSEIAAQLGAPLGTAKSWVRRAIQQLKDCLGV